LNKKNSTIQALTAPIINYSSKTRLFRNKTVKVLKTHQYLVRPERLSGDAPKDLIYVYEYGRSIKTRKKTWIPYISKVGHKWYPTESITEHLLTRFGQAWGFNVAESKLYVFAGQLRFCSELFRKPNQELVHGADILARHLSESDAFIIEQIDKNGWSQELLTLSFISQALKEVFQEDSDKIIDDLINLLLFDAMVGNNDRHFFNWGVLRHLKGKHKPYLSPIYDTARGMFWNYTDSSLMSILADEKHLSHHIVKYNNNTKPKIGWEGEKAINHFQLVENIIKNDMCSIPYLINLFSNDNLNKAITILNTEFNELITPPRKQLIVRNLQYRFETFNHLLGF
jgi:hypothetical protein